MSRYRNLILILKNPYAIWSGLIIASFLWYVIEYFSDRGLIFGNFWSIYATINLTFDILNVLLIWLFVASFVYKRRLFGRSSKNNQSGWFGSITSVLVSGCPACSITLASYLGLASFFALLPYNGLELKIVGTLVLIWSVYTNIKNLTVCSIKK
jgi:hypothetical protein